MKRPITNLVMGWMALFLAVFQLNAQTTFSVDPPTVTGNPGDQFTVEIKVSDFTNILSFQYSMTWNESAIEFVAPVSVSGNLNGLSATSSFGLNNAGDGVITTSWLDPDVAGITLPDQTVIYSLTFKILTTVGTNIAFGQVPTVYELVDGNGNPLNLLVENGMVNGGGSGNGGGNPGDLIITASDETAAAGSNICVDFSVENFDDILSVQYSMHFNPAILDFSGVAGLNLPGLVASQFGTNNSSNGTITLSWLDPDVSGVTVPNGTVIYQICFDVIGSSGQSSNITINGVPTVIEVVDGNGDPVDLIVDPGVVNVSGGNPPPPPPINGFAILASDQTVENGDNFCMEFSVQDFDNILSMQYTMQYDASKIKYTGIQALNLPGLVPSMFNAANPGVISFSWLDPDVSGVTVPDGTVIYEICFDAIGANNCNNSNQLIFTGASPSIEIVDGNGDPVDFNSSPGVTTICDDPNGGGGGGGGGDPTNLTFTASSEFALTGEELCVDVSVDLFDCVVSAQYSMHFNPAVLDYTIVNNFGLPGMTLSGNFGVTAASNGVITFSWLDPDVAGVTLPNGTVIYSVCFEVIGSLGQTSPFTFDGIPTPLEVTDCNPTDPDPDFVSGTQTVGNSCPGPVSITSSLVTNIACFGTCTGSVDISVTGGNSTYTYVWTNGAGQPSGTNQDLTAACPGTYTVVVSSCNGNETATATYTIAQPSSGINITGVPTPVTCFGETTGEINLTVTGGTVNLPSCNLQYAWSNGATTQDLTGLAPGTFVVTVTDCGNCQQTASFTVIGPPSALTFDATPTPTLCSGGCSGQINTNVSGGVPPYQYMLNSGAWQNIGTYNNLCAGTYLIKTRDALGCIKQSSILVTSPPLLTATASATNTVNGNDGSVDLTPAGGTPGYTYSWTGPNNYTASTQDINNLSPGDYCVTVTDANQCTTTRCEEVRSPLSLTGMNVTPSCHGQCTGQLEVLFSGGSPPYTYAWSGGSIPGVNPTPANLCPNQYTVTVTSSDGQTATLTGTVVGAPLPVQITNAIPGVLSLPNSTDGSVTLSVTGGFGPNYTYNWSNGFQLNTPMLTGVGEGQYSVTVTDMYGCTTTGGPYHVFYDPDPLEVVEANDVIICASDSSAGGTLQVTVQGGIKPYKFTFTGPTPIAPIDNNTTGTVIRNNLQHGIYTINISDSAPGSFLQQLQLTVNLRLIDIEIDPVVIRPVTNGNDGGIDITVSGGDPIYTFQWSNGSNGQDLSNIPEGPYSLFIEDSNGCVEEFISGLEVKRLRANGVVKKTDCPNDSNGSITLNPTGTSNLPLTYLWNTGETTSSLNNLDNGNHTVTITDAIGAFITQTFTVSSESNLNVDVDPSGEILCAGDNTGGAVAMPFDGVPSYTYLWNTGATTPNISGVSAGLYNVVVQDAAGCQVTGSVTISGPDPLGVNIQTDNGGNCTNGNGTAKATPTGGTPPFTYKWNDPLNQTSQTAILLAPGVYRVSVTDANGCTMTEDAFIDEVQALEVNGIGIPDSGGPDGQAIVVVISGTYPFTYVWRDYLETDSILTELLPDTYYVRVTDAAGCEELIGIVVEDATICLEASAIITPEGDGFNEEFKFGCLSRYSDNRLEIFNRWGQLVYLANNYNNGNLWRGTNRRGGDVPDGVYYYVFEYLDPVTGTEQTQKGAVTVLRQ